MDECLSSQSSHPRLRSACSPFASDFLLTPTFPSRYQISRVTSVLRHYIVAGSIFASSENGIKGRLYLGSFPRSVHLLGGPGRASFVGFPLACCFISSRKCLQNPGCPGCSSNRQLEPSPATLSINSTHQCLPPVSTARLDPSRISYHRPVSVCAQQTDGSLADGGSVIVRRCSSTLGPARNLQTRRYAPTPC